MRANRRRIFLVSIVCCTGLALAALLPVDRVVATLEVPALNGIVTLTAVDARLIEIPGFENSHRRYLITFLGQEGVDSSFALTSASERYRGLNLVSLDTSRSHAVLDVVPDLLIGISLRPSVRVCWEVQ